MKRKIKEIITGSTQYDGAGVKLVRVVGNRNVYDFDPFLMMDAFDSDNYEDYIRGFPWHPHRGIETVTYLIRGEIEHGDSLGNKGVINDGCCQWMTAGRGIMHQEMPQKSDKMLGVQLWLNLPRKDKMTKPSYLDIRNEDITEIDQGNVKVRVIAGEFNGVKGKVKGEYVDMTFLDISIDKDNELEIDTRVGDTVFVYILTGAANFDLSQENLQQAKNAILFTRGNKISVRTGDSDVRFLLFSAKALKEPIAWGGPIVMNTEEELRQAFAEIRSGQFIQR